MDERLHLAIAVQPDDFTCGPTCLHAVYGFYGDDVELAQVVAKTPRLRNGGTLAVWLACHALRRGYRATVYTYNLQLFDPVWFQKPSVDLAEKLRAQEAHKTGSRFHASTRAYLEFLELGGEIRFEDLTANLLRRYLKRGIPILTGLSSTYLYQCAREYGPNDDYDDVRGTPSGHFVVLSGYRKDVRSVMVADPLHPNPVSEEPYYDVSIERLIGAILLGVLTYDANLLVIQPREQKKKGN